MFKKLSLALVFLSSIHAFASHQESENSNLSRTVRSLKGDEQTRQDEAFKHLKEGRVKSARITWYSPHESTPPRCRFEITLNTEEVLNCGIIQEKFIFLFSRFLTDRERRYIGIYKNEEQWKALEESYTRNSRRENLSFRTLRTLRTQPRTVYDNILSRSPLREDLSFQTQPRTVYDNILSQSHPQLEYVQNTLKIFFAVLLIGIIAFHSDYFLDGYQH